MPNCADAVEQGLLCAGWRKDRSLGFRPEPAKQGRAEDQPAQQLADDGGLADPLHHFAEPAPDRNQKRYLDQQQEFGRATGVFACRARRRDRQ